MNPRDGGIARLDHPGLFQRFVLEEPWPLVALLLLAGVIALVLLNQRARAGLGLVCLAVAAALAVAVYGASAAVETTEESLRARTRALVAAALSEQPGALAAMLEAGAAVDVLGGTRREGRDAVVQLVADWRARYPLRSWSVSDVRAVVDGESVARCQFRFSAEPEATRLPSGSWWIVTWRKDAGGQWQAWTISAQQIDGVGAGSRVGL